MEEVAWTPSIIRSRLFTGRMCTTMTHIQPKQTIILYKLVKYIILLDKLLCICIRSLTSWKTFYYSIHRGLFLSKSAHQFFIKMSSYLVWQQAKRAKYMLNHRWFFATSWEQICWRTHLIKNSFSYFRKRMATKIKQLSIKIRITFSFWIRNWLNEPASACLSCASWKLPLI